jgi:hypothetical protein
VQYQSVSASISPQVAFNTKVLVFGATGKFQTAWHRKEPLRSFAENTSTCISCSLQQLLERYTGVQANRARGSRMIGKKPH